MGNFFNIDNSSQVDSDCKLSGNITIGKNCKILNSRLENVEIGDNVTIVDSSLCGAKIHNNVSIGPYARIRPDTIIFDDVKIGNFCEIKNSIVGKRSKIPHLSYVGDAEIGEDCNIGCGVIFCNYDGKNKTKSIVGDRVFIGSNCNIISPVILEDETFIAAGTTVTDNVAKGEFCIGRSYNEIKHGVLNMYLQNFSSPLKYFGTDGIRGVFGENLTLELCQKVGYSLSKMTKNAKVLIGRDTRESGEKILNSIAKGLSIDGAEIFDAGIISTAGVAFLTRFFEFDYGVMITASHNSSEYNGIKIFNKNGYKLNENQEILLEKGLKMQKTNKKPKIKKVSQDAYINFLGLVCDKDLTNLNILLDLSNGAVCGYAKNIFESLGARTFVVNDGGEINKNASVLDENIFIQNMQKSNCDIGFCFDGDADRVMCITKDNVVLDGDKILWILAKYKKEKYAVGTIMTNLAMEKHLTKIGTRLIRTDVGDRNIAKIMKSKKYNIGAETSGHIIIRELSTTGDGILTALYLLKIYKENPELFDRVKQLNMYSTVNLSVKTENKKIIKNDNVLCEIKKQEKLLGTSGRIIVRASGTEPKIRITVECKDTKKAESVANKIKKTIENLL